MGEEGATSPLKEISSTSFGYIIGFILPGLFGLYSLGLWSRDVQDLLQPALSKDATIGPSLFLLLSSLTMGLSISALRYWSFERLICKEHSLDKEIFRKLGTGEKLAAFNGAVEQHYRYHQFYGGCAIAVLIAFPRWIYEKWQQLDCAHVWLLVLGFLACEALLVATARNSYIRYVERGNNIVEGERRAG